MVYSADREKIQNGDIGLVTKDGFIANQTNRAYERLRGYEGVYSHSLIFFRHYGRVFVMDMQPKGGDIRLASIHFRKKEYKDFVIVRPKDKVLIDGAMEAALYNIELYSKYDFGQAIDLWVNGMFGVKTKFGKSDKDVCSELTQYYAGQFDPMIGIISDFFPQDHLTYLGDKFELIK